MVGRLLRKLKTEPPYDPAIPLLEIHLKEYKSANNKDTCTSMFTAVLFTIAKPWKQPRCPTTDKWIKKMYTQWNSTQPQRRMKFCCLQVSGWNWRS
jgi:hypothetical protein